MAKHVAEASKTPFRRAVWCVEDGEAPFQRLEYFVEVGGMRRRKKHAALAGCKKKKTRKRSET